MTGQYPTPVYCHKPNCLNTAYAICGHDMPTCEEHGNEHTCEMCEED